MTTHHIEPAPRIISVDLSADELRALVRHHELYNRVLERELPGLVDANCAGNAHSREAIVKLGAMQLTAHQARRDELALMLEGVLGLQTQETETATESGDPAEADAKL